MSDSSYIHPGSLHRVLSNHPALEERLRTQGVWSCGLAQLKESFWVRRTGAPYHVLLYTTGGKGHLEEVSTATDGRTVRPGDRVWAPADTAHYYHSNHRWDKMWFHLDPSRWHLEGSPSGPPFYLGRARLMAEIEQILKALFHETEGTEAHREEVLGHWVNLLCLTLKRDLGPHPGRLHDDAESLDRVFTAVRQDPSRPWDLAELARTFPRHVTPNHFYKICHRHLHLSPREKLARIRMEAARELLSHTSLPLERVAALVGYANAFGFSAAYKRHTGRPPSRDRAG